MTLGPPKGDLDEFTVILHRNYEEYFEKQIEALGEVQWLRSRQGSLRNSNKLFGDVLENTDFL